VVVGLAIWSVGTLQWQGDVLSLFPASWPEIQDLREMQLRGNEQFSLLAIVPRTAHDDPAQVAARLEHVAQALANSPQIARAEVLTDLAKLAPQAWAAVFISLPPEKFTEFTRASEERGIRDRLAAAKTALGGWPDPAQWAKVHYDPLGFAEWVVKPAAAKDSAVSPSMPNAILRVVPKTRANTLRLAAPPVQEVRDELARNGFGRDDVLLTGEAAYVAEIGGQMQREMIGMAAAAVVLISILFLIVYRSWFPLLALLILMGAGLLAGLVAARLAWGSVNLLCVAFASVAVGLCADYTVVVYHYFSRGGSSEGASWRSLRGSLLFCAGTVAAGLTTFVASVLPGLQEFGVLLGVTLIVVVLLALGPWAQWVARHTRATNKTSALDELETSPPGWLVKAGWAVLIGGWLLSAWAVAHPAQVLDLSWARLSDPGLEAQRGQDVLEAYLPRDIGPDSESRWAANRKTWQTRQPVEIERIFQEEGFAPPLSTAYQGLFSSLAAWSKGDETLESWHRGATAFPRLQAHLPSAVGENTAAIAVPAVLLILGLMAWALRSAGSVGRVLLINLAGSGWWLAGLALWHQPISLAGLASLPLILGLSVDYSILGVRFLKQHGKRWPLAARELGRPLALCATVSVIGFGVTGFSTQPVLRNFGVVTGWGVFCAFLAAAVGLPALFGRIKKPGGHASGLYSAFWFSVAARLARVTPRRLAQSMAGTAGRIYALTHPQKSAVIRANQQLLTGKVAAPEVAQTVCAHFARNLADYFYLGTHAAAGTSLFVERLGYEHLKAAHDAGRGALLLTCHYGFFEGGGALMQEFGFPTVSLTAPEPSESLTRWRAAFRKRWGLGTLEVTEDPFFLLSILQELRENRFLVALIDRPRGGSSVRVSVPGGNLKVAAHIVLAAQAAQAPVIPVLINRRADGFYRVWAAEPVWIEGKGSPDATAEFYAQKVMHCLLERIGQDDDQWVQFVSLSSSPSV
jgi:KDO2-lipid IV(A) lauroyltransferase